jgi:hypothetical protein
MLDLKEKRNMNCKFQEIFETKKFVIISKDGFIAKQILRLGSILNWIFGWNIFCVVGNRLIGLSSPKRLNGPY